MSLRPRILLIGPLPRAGHASGGTQVSFGELVENFHASGRFEIELVDTTREHVYEHSWRAKLSNLTAMLRVVREVMTRGRDCDLVFFNASARGLLIGGPLVCTAARRMGKPVIVRAFGGGLDEALASAPFAVRRAVERTVLRADLLALQTNALCSHFAGVPAAFHFPTTRRMERVQRARSRTCRRFLFLSQLRPEKGIREALHAIELAPEGCTLSVHGPLMHGVCLSDFAGASRSRYGGELERADVARVLAEHDALVFPSYWDGEGLPGVIVEALQSSLPVIAARWRSVPELVESGVNGLLVEPRSAESLAQALRRVASDDALFARLCAGAEASAREHSAEQWHAKLEARMVRVLSPQSADDIAAPLPRRAAHRARRS